MFRQHMLMQWCMIEVVEVAQMMVKMIKVVRWLGLNADQSQGQNERLKEKEMR